MEVEIIRTTWRRSEQSLAIEYRGEYGSQPQVLIMDAKDILRMWLVWLASEDAAEHPLHSDAGDSGEKLETDPAKAPAQVS
jgi:hypothetical protein